MSIYLAWGLALSAAAVLALILDTASRKIATLSGIGAMPVGLLDFFFVIDYWSPGHLIGPSLSIEGVLFSFGNGVLAWIIAISPFRAIASYNVQFRALILRYHACSAAALLVIFAIWDGGLGLIGFSFMESTFVALAVVGLVMIAMQRGLMLIAISGAVLFAIFYCLFQLMVISMFAPEFSAAWHASERDGIKIFGFPMEEMIWASLYGAVWNMGVAFGCNVRVKIPTRQLWTPSKAMASSDT